MQSLMFLIEAIGSILVTACLLRAYAPWANVSARNPLMQFAIAATDWAVKPVRMLVPARRGFDFSALLAGFILAAILATITVFGLGLGASGGALTILILSIYWMIKWGLYALMALVILQAILSWVNPEAPIAPVIDQLTRPFLAPIRRVVPLIGNVDISPLILIVAIQLLLNLAPNLLGMVGNL